MKRAVAVFASLAISVAAYGAPPSDASLRVGVADAVQRYANAISCGGVQVKPQDVMVLEPGKEDVAMPRYAVLWTGDLGCNGGSGTEGTRLAIATFNTGKYVVRPELSSPVVAFESPVRFVLRVAGYSAGTLVLEGREYAPGDPNSNPTLPVRFTLRADAKGDWRLAAKERLDSAAMPPAP